MKKQRRSGGGTERRRGRLLDRFQLYELCAQNPARDVRMLRAIHGGEPRVLGEDFCGTGALSRAWVGLSARHRAVAVDHDPEALRRVRGVARVRARRLDVMDADDRADVIAVLNFSICELHTRRALVRYLRHARARLNTGGVLVVDIYAGADAFNTGRVAQRVPAPWGGRITYEWEQRHADPLTGRVVNAMHFVTPGAGNSRVRIEDAFVYDWRLWSVPELREAMSDAGFAATAVYSRFADAQDADGNLYASPVIDPRELGESFSAYVVGGR